MATAPVARLQPVTSSPGVIPSGGLNVQVAMAEDGLALQPQPPGAIMAHHCIQFATMVQLGDTPSHASIPSLLALLARSAELAHIHIRQGLPTGCQWNESLPCDSL